MLRNGLLRYILYTFATDPSSIWHVHTWSMRRNIHIHTPCTQGRWTTWLNLRHTNARAPSCDMIDAAECSMQIQNFDMRQRNAKSCESTDASNPQTCDKVRVQSGMQWCASVIHLPKCVVTIVFKRLRHGVVRSMLYICPNHATPCCNLFLIHAFILCHSWFVFDVH